MRSQLKDPELRAKVWPDYTFGCKRILFSSEFLPALQRPNVELVTERDRARSSREGVRTADGRLHELDCLIWATGFQHQRLHVPDGDHRRAAAARCEESWAERRARAPRDDACPAFPNMFVMYGPNTNTSGGSIIFYLETQAAYMRQALQQLARAARARSRCAPRSRRPATARCSTASPARRGRECDSWYRDEHGPDRRQLARLHARVPAADRVAGRRRVQLRAAARAARRR